MLPRRRNQMTKISGCYNRRVLDEAHARQVVIADANFQNGKISEAPAPHELTKLPG